MFTYDSGFTATASCKSAITYIDGDNGVLLYRGYPIEQLDTLSLHTEGATQAIAARAVSLGANLRVYFENYLCISLDETTRRADIELLWKVFARDGQALPTFAAFEKGVEPLAAPSGWSDAGTRCIGSRSQHPA
ncbi:citrate/2-methylcitrate synthase [Dickeya chrysanthemi]|uniref:citrate/2-methylcitrate synthase n=1 Tax=Dickeya chrysanthemi TaxID=556 RepID=UPI0025A288C4|nr:citrate/2-methylcitrate synthase [Dickeya chrysanthemi]WJM87698.1 citrate/2-methylcitrate synthase [Dickeya chrysanthemi]